MISDVIRKGSFYQTLNESGKKIKEVHQNSVGELQGFTDRFIVFRKGSFSQLMMRTLKRLKKSIRTLLAFSEVRQDNI